jgi:hypothetical protein
LFDIIVIASTLHELQARCLGIEAVHDGETQLDLNRVFALAPDAVRQELDRTIASLHGRLGRPLRVLDIGSGYVPYGKPLLAGLESGKIESLELWDEDPHLHPPVDRQRGYLGALLAHPDRVNSMKTDIFDELSFDPEGGDSCPGGLLACLRRILASKGRLILAEFFYPDDLPPGDAQTIARLMRKKCGHGDPPEVFFAPDTLEQAARDSGFVVRNLELLSPLVPETVDEAEDRAWLGKRRYVVLNLEK